MLSFSAHPPTDDDDLGGRIIERSDDGVLNVFFAGNMSTPLSTVKRVVSLANQLDVRVRGLDVPTTIMLRVYEQTTPERASEPLAFQHVRDLKTRIEYQRAPRQMNEFSAMLSNSSVRTLKLAMCQYRTETFLQEDEKILDDNKKYGEENLQFLQPILGMPTPYERRMALEAEESQDIARALVEQIGGTYIPPALTAPHVDHEVMQLQGDIVAALLNEEMTLTPAIDSAPAPTDDNMEVDAAPTTVSVCVPLDRRDVPRCIMDRAESGNLSLQAVLSTPAEVAVRLRPGQFLSEGDEDETLAAFLTTPLPGTLTVLHLKIKVPRAFAERHTRFLAGAHALVELQLNFCDITDVAMEHLVRVIAGMRSLKTLDLERNRLINPRFLNLIVGPSLERISLALNPLTGPAVSDLLTALHGNRVLSHVNLEGTNLRQGHLSVDNLDLWAAPNAFLRLPNKFTAEERRRLEELMPDGSTLDLVSFSYAGDPVMEGLSDTTKQLMLRN